MFQVSFWCGVFPVSIPEIKWSYYPDILQCYVCEEAWFTLNFHVVLKTLFIGTRALFRVLCLGVSISVFGLFVYLMETELRLVVLVAVAVMGPGCMRLVQIVVLVIEFSRAWEVLHISIGFVCFFLCNWYDPSYWSLLLSLVMLFYKNF